MKQKNLVSFMLHEQVAGNNDLFNKSFPQINPSSAAGSFRGL